MKKFILRIMACLMMAVMIGTCLGNAKVAFADDVEVKYTGTVTAKTAASWWYGIAVTQAELLGDVKPEDVAYIEFTGTNNFIIQYHNTTGDSQDNKDSEYYSPYTNQTLNGTSHTAKNIDFTAEGYMFNICFSQAEDIDCTVTWKVYATAAAAAETPAEEPKAEAPAVSGTAVDLSARVSVWGQETGTDNADGSVTYKGGSVDKCCFPLPYTVATGDTITVVAKLKFESADDESVRFYLTNSNMDNCTAEIKYVPNTGAEATETTITLTAAQAADCIMFAASAYGVKVQNVTICSITVYEGEVEVPAEKPAEEPKAEEPKAEEPKAEEPKAEETKTEEPKTEEPKEAPVVTGDEYVVKAGDTLRAIAKAAGVSVEELAAANDIENVNLIRKGAKLVIPAVDNTARHLVVAGDTLVKIAKAHGVTVADLVAANGLADPNLIVVGQVIVLP